VLGERRQLGEGPRLGEGAILERHRHPGAATHVHADDLHL
jgi:hypothetical protein